MIYMTVYTVDGRTGSLYILAWNNLHAGLVCAGIVCVNFLIFVSLRRTIIDRGAKFACVYSLPKTREKESGEAAVECNKVSIGFVCDMCYKPYNSHIAF